MKTRNEVKPNYAPLYAGALYPDLAKVFVQHGYALAVHGSLARDIDLIAVPWDDNPSSVKEIIEAVNNTFAVKIVGEPEQKNHGRIAYTLALGFGECSIDLSFLLTPNPTNHV